MKKIKIQNIDWKNRNSIQNTDCLFFEGKGYITGKEYILIEKGGYLDFFSYVNIFNYEKWSKYTNIENLRICLEMDGYFEVLIKSHNVLPSNKKNLKSDDKIIIKKNVGCRGRICLSIPTGPELQILSLRVRSLNGGRFISASWTADIKKEIIKEPKIALVFCTYNRDEYLFKNLERLKENLPANYSVIVIDNASRIDGDDIRKYGVNFSLFHNPNTGGSGGFTRGLLEALKSSEGFSHVHFMDDDVEVDPLTLHRVSILLTVLKNKYRKHFLSGAMFRMDNPSVIHESTASWNGIRIKSYKKNLDMRKPEDLLFCEIEESPLNQYAAWWSCVIPLTEGIENDLPLPFFIYGDDMEYSFRRAEGIIALNGIFVWHEPFEYKFSKVLKSYFLCRNCMIINTIHKDRFNLFHVLAAASVHFFVQILVHDYESAELSLDAMDDYLKGGEWFMKSDDESILKDKRKNESAFESFNQSVMSAYYEIEMNFKRFNAFKYFFHSKIAAVSFDGKQVDLRDFSFKKFVLINISFIKNIFIFVSGYNKIQKGYVNIVNG